MDYNEKKDAIYIRGVVLANSITDSDGDRLDKISIKKVFTSYANRNDQDIMHNFTKTSGISTVSNEILKKDETIGDKIVPSGSWVCDSIIFDTKLKELVKNNQITGYSLGAIQYKNPDEYFKEGRNPGKGNFNFKDLISAECLNPLFISLVDKAANGYTLDVYDYNSYLTKNTKTRSSEYTMQIENNILLNLGKSLIKFAKQEEDDNTPKQEEENENVKEVLTKSEEKEALKKAADKVEENPDQENENDDEPKEDLEDKINLIEEKLVKYDEYFKDITPEELHNACEIAKNPKEDEEESESESVVDEPKLEKSTEKLNTPSIKEETSNNFFTKTNRNPITGCKTA